MFIQARSNPCSGPRESSPNPQTSFSVRSIIIIFCHLGLCPKKSLSFTGLEKNIVCIHHFFHACYMPHPSQSYSVRYVECWVMWQQPAGLFSVLVEWVHMAPHRGTCPNRTRTLPFYTHNPVLSTSAHRTPFYIQCTLKREHLQSRFIYFVCLGNRIGCETAHPVLPLIRVDPVRDKL